MTGRNVIFLAISALFFINGDLHAEDSNPQPYALMQECLAQATEVIDNGSYERFCVERYLATSEWDDEVSQNWHKDLNSKK